MKRSLLAVFAVSALVLVGCGPEEPAVEEIPAAEEEPAAAPAPAMPMDTMAGMPDTMPM